MKEFTITYSLDDEQLKKLRAITKNVKNYTNENGEKQFADVSEELVFTMVMGTGSKYLIDEKLEIWKDYLSPEILKSDNN